MLHSNLWKDKFKNIYEHSLAGKKCWKWQHYSSWSLVSYLDLLPTAESNNGTFTFHVNQPQQHFCTAIFAGYRCKKGLEFMIVVFNKACWSGMRSMKKVDKMWVHHWESKCKQWRMYWTNNFLSQIKSSLKILLMNYWNSSRLLWDNLKPQTIKSNGRYHKPVLTYLL